MEILVLQKRVSEFEFEFFIFKIAFFTRSSSQNLINCRLALCQLHFTHELLAYNNVAVC
jgi:hypothetical protein